MDMSQFDKDIPPPPPPEICPFSNEPLYIGEDKKTPSMESQDSDDSLVDIAMNKKDLLKNNNKDSDTNVNSPDNEPFSTTNKEVKSYAPPIKIPKNFITNCVSTRTKNLPDGWKAIAHDSGHFVYLHLGTRVVTYSKPFELKDGSARHHDTPLASIPCLEQKKHLEKVKQKQESGKLTDISEYETISSEELKNYSTSLFEYETKYITKFDKNMPKSERKRKYADYFVTEGDDIEEEEEIPDHFPCKPKGGFPSNGHLINIECPGTYGKKARTVQFNPVGKSSTNILHEYIQRSMKTKVHYAEEQFDFDAYVFHCSCYLIINEIVKRNIINNERIVEKLGKIETRINRDEEQLFVGKGKGKSKREAKLAAGVNSVKLFLEDLTFDDNGICKAIGGKSVEESDIIQFFKSIDLEHAKLADLCEKSGQLTPNAVLQIAIRNHPNAGTFKLQSDCQTTSHGRHIFSLSFGNLAVDYECKNKKEGKQIAAQKFIKLLHPECTTWGEIIEIYGTKSQSTKEAKLSAQKNVIKMASEFMEESKAKMKHSYEPNLRVLNALKEHHKKFYDQFSQDCIEQHINDIKRPILYPDIAAKASRKKEMEYPTSLWKNAL
uniref:Microprocessor complex subunit DGCR8 (inferred by orthology to a human protein) n=1 Tax=Strongyloides venezuelensis TaxID=75913 RepID=A0A0K0FYB1_STRVS